MNGAICGDNRFEIIEKAKQAILEETNIKDDKAQMAELDSFLFRCWQMGWLKKYDQDNEGKTAERTKKEVIEKAVEWLSNNMFNSINNGVIINGYCVSDFIGRFKHAMQDESRRLD